MCRPPRALRHLEPANAAAFPRMLAPSLAVLLSAASAAAQAQAPGSMPPPPPGASVSAAQARSTAGTPASRTWSSAVFVELASSFVPVANDVPLMVGVGVRFARIHEVWARAGYMPVGDDVGHGFGVVGYRAALRPGRLVRPILGGYFAGLPATCGHDSRGRPSCTPERLYIFSATGGVRVEPSPWLGFSALLSLGIDSYPNPFGMVELAATFALPLS